MKILYETVFVDSVRIGSEGNNMHVLELNPIISWAYHSNNNSSQKQYEIEIGINDNWDIAEVWNSGTVNSPDTFMVYSETPLNDGETYYLRIRVRDSLYWSQWYETQFLSLEQAGEEYFLLC